MTQLTITLDNTSAQILKRAAKKNAKQIEQFARELLEWYAKREADPLFMWKPMKNSGKGIKDSALKHDQYSYSRKR